MKEKILLDSLSCSYVLTQHTNAQVLSAVSKVFLSFEDVNENRYCGFVQNCYAMEFSCAQILNQLIKIV
jgi:hypothetical protein